MITEKMIQLDFKITHLIYDLRLINEKYIKRIIEEDKIHLFDEIVNIKDEFERESTSFLKERINTLKQEHNNFRDYSKEWLSKISKDILVELNNLDNKILKSFI